MKRIALILLIAPIVAWSDVGDIGHWRQNTGGALPGTTFTGFNFPTEVRNDNATYTKPTVTQLGFNEGGSYLVRWNIKHDDASNGRVNIQCHMHQATGATSNQTSYGTGYSRNSNNRTAWCQGAGLIKDAITSDVFSIRWKRDTDAPTGGVIASASDLQVVRLPDGMPWGIYQDSGSAAYGTTTPTEVSWDTNIEQTDTSSIERVGNEIFLRGDNKRYLISYGIAGDAGASRTQRVSQLFDGTDEVEASRSYCYQRNSANEFCGMGALVLVETSTTDIPITLRVWLGDGVANGQGGADVAGNWNSDVGAGTSIAIIELPDHVEVFASSQTGAGTDSISSGTVIDFDFANTVHFIDSGSFTAINATTIDAAATADYLLFANSFGTSNNVASGARLTRGLRFELAGSDRTIGEHGNYMRQNQGSQDTFGWASNISGIWTLSAGADIQLENFDAGDNGSTSTNTPVLATGAFGINLDTLVDTTPPATRNRIRIISEAANDPLFQMAVNE